MRCASISRIVVAALEPQIKDCPAPKAAHGRLSHHPETPACIRNHSTVKVAIKMPKPVSANRLVGGGKVLTGNNIGGIAETQEMLDFCAEHGLGAVIEKVGVNDVDAAYERVVAGDVKFRFVIDTATFAEH